MNTKMKNMNRWLIGAVAAGVISASAFGQGLPPAPSGDREPPPRGERPEGPPPPPPHERDRDDRGPCGREGGPPPYDRDDERGPRGPRGPGGDDRDGPPPPPRDRGPGGGSGGPGGPRNQAQAMREYVELVDKYTMLAANPSAAGVSAVVSLTDIMKSKGPEATIAKLNELLPTAKDPAVQRALRLQLIDLYKSAKQDDKAIEQAEILIKG